MQDGIFNPNCPGITAASMPFGTKNPLEKFRITIYLRPVNAATNQSRWPMPNFESEQYEFAGRKRFKRLDFCAGCWQCPLDTQLYDACRIIVPEGVFESKRLMHAVKNILAYFQSSIPLLLHEVYHHLKTWIDDKIIDKNQKPN